MVTLREATSGLLVLLAACSWLRADEPIDIGSRLELMVDEHLIHQMSGGATLRLHPPTPRNVAIVHDAPWEGNNCGYETVFQDGDVYRMYYSARQLDLTGDKLRMAHPAVICYAESTDGIHWTKPELGLVEFDGSKRNNIIWDGPGTHNFAPLRDANPHCAPEARYKALAGTKREGGLFALQSSDGIHWSLMSPKPVVTQGAFDSQNLAFWDSIRGEYREYHREFRDGRDIMTATSKDFIHWSEPVFLKYEPGRITQLYTNQIAPYYRAPHIFLGFPTRYVAGRGHLTRLNERISRVSMRYGTDYTDGGFITSRDGDTFQVWGQAFIRPGLVQRGRWLYGGNYQSWGIVQTKVESAPPGVTPLLGPADDDVIGSAGSEPSQLGQATELSVYASEGGWVGTSRRLRRYTVRIDGFVSAQAPLTGGEVVTKPLLFSGNRLTINFATSVAGALRVEIQDQLEKPIAGFALADCAEIFGDRIEQTVTWKRGSDVGDLAGRPIRLRIELKDADLYSFRFGK